MPSVVSQADAMLKMVQAIPWLGDSDAALEELGFSDDQMLRRAPTVTAQGSGRSLLRLQPHGPPA